MTDKAKAAATSPITIAALAGCSLIIALGVAFATFASDDASRQDLKRSQAAAQAQIEQSSKENCENLLRLRDAAIVIVKRAAAAAVSDEQYTEAEKRRLIRFHAEQVGSLEAVDCEPADLTNYQTGESR